MLCMIAVIVMCVYLFPQCVDEALDVAGEDFSQAKEAVPGDTAVEGKPSPKTQPLSYVLNFFLSLYHAVYHYYVSCITWDGNYCRCNR